jgi:hypothetical protein
MFESCENLIGWRFLEGLGGGGVGIWLLFLNGINLEFFV